MRKIAYIRYCPPYQSPQLEDQEFDKTFEDDAYGSRLPRPELDALRKELQKGDVIYVQSLCRIGMTTHHLKELVKEIMAKGAELISIKEGVHFCEENKKGMEMFHAIGTFLSGVRGEAISAGIRLNTEMRTKLRIRKDTTVFPKEVLDQIESQLNSGVSLFMTCKNLGIPFKPTEKYFRRKNLPDGKYFYKRIDVKFAKPLAAKSMEEKMEKRKLYIKAFSQDKFKNPKTLEKMKQKDAPIPVLS